jgi:hypothetical protein
MWFLLKIHLGIEIHIFHDDKKFVLNIYFQNKNENHIKSIQKLNNNCFIYIICNNS